MKIKELPDIEKPRERLIKYGAKNISNEELLAILLRTGGKDNNVKIISSNILSKLKNYRTITFCTSIAQSEVLGKNCIHSKNKTAQVTLNKFNEGKIKHISACHMLNEGVNLTNCKYGIFANINASETIQIQRVGKL